MIKIPSRGRRGGEKPFTILKIVPYSHGEHIYIKRSYLSLYISIRIITVESLRYGQFSFMHMPS